MTQGDLGSPKVKTVAPRRINTKAKGSKREVKAKKLLEAIGYDVTKAAASLGAWDLVAMHRTHWRLIQVKSNRRPEKLEMERMLNTKVPPGTSKEVWIYVDGERWPRVEVLP